MNRILLVRHDKIGDFVLTWPAFYLARTAFPDARIEVLVAPDMEAFARLCPYIDDVITRLTVFGSLYVTAVCLLPEFMIVAFNITFQLGGTALLIVVVVAVLFYAAYWLMKNKLPPRDRPPALLFNRLHGAVHRQLGQFSRIAREQLFTRPRPAPRRAR